MIAVSAHTIAEVRAAAAQGADFAVLAPIFEKVHSNVPAIGLDALRAACANRRHRSRFAVLALGGVTVSNAVECLRGRRRGGRRDSFVSER